MKNAFRDIDLYNEFAEDEPVRFQIKRKRRRSDLNEAGDRQRQSKKQNSREHRKKKTRGDDWREWTN